jgi:Fe-S-cluster containining protein
MSKNKAALARAVQRREELARRKRDEREAKRIKRVIGDRQPLTFGQVIDRLGLLRKTSIATREIIRRTVADAEEFARKSLKVISCHSCLAPKGCCKISTMAYLYEAVPIAERLIRDGRDVADLRGKLQVAAEAMESTPSQSYDRPCVFLTEAERCSVYEDRPSACGSHLVFSDPSLCSSDDPAARTENATWPYRDNLPEFEQRFAMETRLHQTGVPYVGALPRMVLVCLQAWDRIDYIDFLAEECRSTTLNFLRATAGQKLRTLGLTLPG